MAEKYEVPSTPAVSSSATLAPPRDWSAKPVPREQLLNDDQVAKFICDGYILIDSGVASEINAEIDAQLDTMTVNPGDRIWEEVPLLSEVYERPAVRGALASLLGHDVKMSSHRHWHSRRPGPWSQGWHQDSVNVRHHQLRTVLALYYPHDVTAEMGATVIMPGTHFRNAPTDRMATYCNIRGQVPIIVKAGTVAIVHYDIWHGGSINRSNRTRHMLKFLFTRGKDPVAPEWNHDPVNGLAIAQRRFGEWPPFCSQSDHYKQIGLRRECWNHMIGKLAATAPAKDEGED